MVSFVASAFPSRRVMRREGACAKRTREGEREPAALGQGGRLTSGSGKYCLALEGAAGRVWFMN